MFCNKFLLFFLFLIAVCYGDQLPTCTAGDFHYEYTECDSKGNRWRVSVPKPDTCIGGLPNAPEKGPSCSLACNEGQFLDKDKNQKCSDCLKGTFSLGGGIRYDRWDIIPEHFSTQSLDFGISISNIVNCSNSSYGWIPNGDFLIANPGNCLSKLSYSAKLVKKGTISFTYQYDLESSVLFLFKITNEKCQNVEENDKSNNFVEKSREWNTITKTLSPGINILTWEVMGFGSITETLRKPVLIKSIEISGVAFVSECTPCPAGSFSDENKSAFCKLCPQNTFSEGNASFCKPCKDDSYSFEGSSKCVKKPPCVENDYKIAASFCENNMTVTKYEWIMPQICDPRNSLSVKLPPDSQQHMCPPCNPGSELINGTCKFCQNKFYNPNGIGDCKSCPPKTIASKKFVIESWNNIPKLANISSVCIADSDKYCLTKDGWKVFDTYVETMTKNKPSSFLVLQLVIGEFDVISNNGKVINHLSFTYTTNCPSKKCSFYLMTFSKSSYFRDSKELVLSSKKTTKVIELTSVESIKFSWAFQKNQETEYARIYDIIITNVKNAGSTSCKSCNNKEIIGEECINCPIGQYLPINSTDCERCPSGKVVVKNSGVDACQACPDGLEPNDDGSKCINKCKFTRKNGDVYDFIRLGKIPYSIEGAKLFTGSGLNYFHIFNLSICSNGNIAQAAICSDNLKFEKGHDIIKSSICRLTVVPPSNPKDDKIFTQPISLGLDLINITYKSDINWMDPRFVTAGFDLPSSKNDDTYLTFFDGSQTSACRSGRHSIIILRCDASVKNPGEVILPPKCPDGTCDGCTFLFLWKSIAACPACSKNSYERIVSECVNRRQTITYVAKQKHCVLTDEAPKQEELACMPVPKWLMLIIGLSTVMGLLLISLLIYCYNRNKKLEYKYMKLVGNKSSSNIADEMEMPAAETCALDSSEEDEFDSVKVVKGKGKNILNLLMGKRNTRRYEDFFDTKENPFESISLTENDEKQPLT